MNNQSKNSFLERVSPVINGRKYLLPQPKLSPLDRKRRRLMYRNENRFYKSKSALSGDSIISMYHADSPYTVYSHDEWWSDDWEALDYGFEFDFKRGFFEQFKELQLKVPRSPLVNNKAENSPYCNFADENKNCHMVTSSNLNEDSYYSFGLINSKDSMDCIWCVDSELLYECNDCRHGYNLRFCGHCNNCSESAFLYDCVGVKNSIFCQGLRNCQYYIFNEPVSKEKYQEVFNYYFCGSYQRLLDARKIYQDFLKTQGDLREEFFISSENVEGNNLWNSRNIKDGYDLFDCEDCAHLHDGLTTKDSEDICFFMDSQLCYESTSLIGYHYLFTIFCRDSSDLIYCDSCHACKDCFGCVGLRNKQYCILNKQYGEREYFEILPRIIEAMAERGEWGEFFPTENSFFAYNESLAADYFPMKKSEVLERGWSWREEEISANDKVVEAIPDSLRDVDSTICDKVLSCELSGKKYKILLPELRFYKRLNLPIPRLCSDQRRIEKMRKR